MFFDWRLWKLYKQWTSECSNIDCMKTQFLDRYIKSIVNMNVHRTRSTKKYWKFEKLFIWIRIAVRFWKCVIWKLFSFSKYSMFTSIVVRRKFECFLRSCVVKRSRNCSLLITIITELNFHSSSFDWQFERDRCHKLSLIQSVAHTNWLKTKLFYKWFRIFRSCCCCRKIKKKYVLLIFRWF